jgi:hypothetical protein
MASTPIPPSGIRLLVILLTCATALIHLALAFQFPDGPDPIFILNGLGYLGLVTLLYLPVAPLIPYRGWIRWTLFGYTCLTIILWILIGPKDFIWGYIDKLIEVSLAALLWMEQQTVSQRNLAAAQRERSRL